MSRKRQKADFLLFFRNIQLIQVREQLSQRWLSCSHVCISCSQRYISCIISDFCDLGLLCLGLDSGFLDFLSAAEAVENLAVVADIDEALQTME